MTFRPVPAFVAAALAALALAPSAVAGPAQETDGECADPPQLGQRGASQGKGEKRGHVKRQEQALRCLARAGQGTTRADFNGDGIGDLVVGVPEEDLSTGADAGAVNVIYGSANGLTDAGNQLLTQIFTRAGGNPSEPGDRFGSALAGGDFNGDGRADLAVGVPGEDLGTAADAGMVMVFYGSATGLTHINPSGTVDVWTQASVGVPGDAQGATSSASLLPGATLGAVPRATGRWAFPAKPTSRAGRSGRAPAQSM
jgi:FG-GAP repeat